jgi:hypothetical protein
MNQMNVCFCSDEDCRTNGCKLSRYQNPFKNQVTSPEYPPGVAPLPFFPDVPGKTAPFRYLTKEDVRRIVREEIAKARVVLP